MSTETPSQPGTGPRIATLILAAGPSQRFGTCKALAAVGPETLIRHMISIANSVTPEHVYVVTGAYHEMVSEHVGERAQCIYNSRWEDGMGASLARGVSSLRKDYDAIMVVLSDQVALHTQHLKNLLQRWEQEPTRPACAFYADQMGVPAIFPKSYFPQLMDLSGSHGARRILRDREVGAEVIPIPEAAIDVDTQSDLSRWAAGV